MLYFENNKKKKQYKDELFDDMLEKVKELDPVYWAEKYINIDGKPFRISDNGWKPYVEIYRQLCVNSLRKDAKPIVFKKSRQIGGSVCGMITSLYFLASGQFGTKNKPPIAIMYCFPQLEMAARFSKTKFSGAIKTSKLISKTKNGKNIPYLESQLDANVSSKDSLSFKQFKGGNHIFIESCGLSADRLRGLTASVGIYDEIQDTSIQAIENSKKSLNAALYGNKGSGVQFYFGTPKKKGSYFHNQWLESSQQYYYLKCLNNKCNEYFPLHTPGTNEWEEIWIEDNLPSKDPNHGFIVRCPHCKYEDHKDKFIVEGKWVATNPDPNPRYISFHLNQLFVPGIPRWKVIAEKPENSLNNTEKTWQNEVMGEFYSDGNSPITREDIDDKCGDRSLNLFTKFAKQDNVKIYAGFDWGQLASDNESEGSPKVGKSFCCATVVKTNGPHIIDVIWVEKFKKITPEYKISRVDEIMRNFQVDYAFGDIGYANDLCYTLQMKYGDRFTPIRGLGSLNKKFRYVEDTFPKIIEFDQQYTLESFFETLKKGLIKLPYGNYEHIAWYVEQLSSMDIKTGVDRFGNTTKRFVKGNLVPNDGLMSLLYCFIGNKFLQTRGFKDFDPRHQKDLSKKEAPLIMTGYIPRWRG